MPSALLPLLERLSVASTFALPPELLSRVLFQLDDAEDLHYASLVNKAWRAVATDSRLWEDHFWRFYRPASPVDAGYDAAIHQAREQKRHAAMVKWLRQASSSPSATRVSTPPFMDEMLSSISSSQADSPPADFRHLFAKQMNADEALICDLRHHLNLTSQTLRNLVRLLARHGPASRHLLAALCATQRITAFNVDRFLPPDNDADSSPWPRALHVHFAASEGRTLPHSAHCVDLFHAANTLLGHLQRRDAIVSIKALQDRKQSYESTSSSSLRHRVEHCCQGLEETYESVALFRAASRSEVREYLDLLALFVHSDLQAQDRGAAASRPQPQAGSQAHPTGSTRYQMARIAASLRSLGFTTATGSELKDVDNVFWNAVVYCPAQRSTTPLTLSSIVSAVARRLGITASVSSDTSRHLIVVVEDGAQPATWRPGEEKREWHRFFVDASDTQGRFVWEAEAARRALSRQGLSRSQQDEALEPASPVKLLCQIISHVKLSARDSEGPTTRYEERWHYAAGDGEVLDPSSIDQLGRLRLYLEGRQPFAPAPFVPAILPSSLAMLPSTRAYGSRANPKSLRVVAMYGTQWIIRIVTPHRVGGVERANEILGVLMASRADAFGLDHVLLAQLNHFEVVRGVTPSFDFAAHEQAAGRCSEHVANFLNEDRRQGCGLFGARSVQWELQTRGADPDLTRCLFDRNHPANSRVQFGIGTLVRHRVLGWRGVVVSWDTEYRGWEESMTQLGVDNLPAGGRYQPFYSVTNESNGRSYEAQCQLEAICVPAGTSREDAKEILQSLLGLLGGVRTFGKAFRTLRVARWDARAGKKRQEGKKDAREPLKGQVYLVMNAWMKEAWPYD